MSFIRNVKTNLYKVFTGYGFYLCIIFTVILCFSSYVYMDPDNLNKYSPFLLIRLFDKDFLLTEYNLCSYEIMNAVTGRESWLSMFIPIISAFAFIPLVCDEHEAKSVRFEIFRSSKFSYNLSRFVSACISGGLAVTIGFMIFTAIEWQFFPNISEYQPFMQEMYFERMSNADPFVNNMAFAVLCKFGEMFIYGAFCAVPSIALTAIIRNKYLVICIPFFVKYGVSQTTAKFVYQNWENYNEKLARAGLVIDPDAFSYFTRMGDMMKEILIYSGILLVTGLFFYLAAQGNRYDSGE